MIQADLEYLHSARSNKKKLLRREEREIHMTHQEKGGMFISGHAKKAHLAFAGKKLCAVHSFAVWYIVSIQVLPTLICAFNICLGISL